jgi:hypothetical protein
MEKYFCLIKELLYEKSRNWFDRMWWAGNRQGQEHYPQSVTGGSRRPRRLLVPG